MRRPPRAGVLPSGAIAIATGCLPTPIGRPAVSVATLIGVTVPERPLATYTVLPSGVATMASGRLPNHTQIHHQPSLS